MENKVLSKNLEELVSQIEYFKPFFGKSILVTGATGLIGSVLIKSLLHFDNIMIFACCRSSIKFEKVFEDYKSDNLIPFFCDVQNLDISNLSIDYIVHGASITDSKTFVECPVETIDTALDGTRNLLKQCVNKELQGFVYLSSLEIYGSFNDEKGIKNVSEIDGGYIDSMAVRSSYSEGKRMVETICKSYQHEYGIPIKVARLCQVFGAGIDYNDNRVFMQFARAIIENKDIILRTKGASVRNYCYTTDAVAGILTILAKGTPGQAYNIANMSTTVSIVELANLFCTLFPDSKSKVIFDLSEDVSKLGYNPEIKIQLDTSKICMLGWQPIKNLDDMIRDLISFKMGELYE